MNDEAGVMPWTVYMLECADKTLYTGITNELGRRMAEHAEGKGPDTPKAAGRSGWCTKKPVQAGRRPPGGKSR